MFSRVRSYLAHAGSLPAPSLDPSADRASSILLILLIAADLGFMAFHILHSYSSIATDPRFSLAEERGFPEVFQYVKLFWTVVMLMMLFAHRRRPIFCSWGVLFLYLLVDDAGALHEHIGEWIAETLDFAPMFGLKAHDFGELAVSAVAGTTLLSLIGVAHVFSTPAERRFSVAMAGLLAALVFFGVGVDMLHSALDTIPGSDLLTLIEDGGEMLVVSATCTFVFAVLQTPEVFGGVR